MKRRPIPLAITAVTVLLLSIFAAQYKGIMTASRQLPRSGGHRTDHAHVNSSVASLPVSFEPNVGQTNARVRFMAHASGSTIFFTPSEVVLALKESNGTSKNQLEGTASKIAFTSGSYLAASARIVRLRFVGAAFAPTITGGEMLAGKVNYFVGNDRRRWRTNLPTHSSIIYHELYPGVDLSYDGTAGQLKGTYTVAAGADVSGIRWRYEGVEDASIDEAGDLHIRVASPGKNENASELVERAPVAWQEIDGERVRVNTRYAIAADRSITFDVGSYDRAKALVIDPTLVYSTYFGGTGTEYVKAIAVDQDGSVYITGVVNSSDFPTTAGALKTSKTSANDIFITKVNLSGSATIYSTYLGGDVPANGQERADGIAVDASGNAYVTGITDSTDFPTVNPAQANNGGGTDAFVAKLNPSGSALVYSTYLGGSGQDSGTAIAVDTAGSACVTGFTSSMNFPTRNPFQPSNGSLLANAFVTKLNPEGTALIYSTYLGGVATDFAFGIAVDSTGAAYVTGQTSSVNFPTKNAFQPVYGGGDLDGFVSKLMPDGGALVYSTFVGGLSTDGGFGIAVDSDSSAYITGATSSSNFPVTASAFQVTRGGSFDAFVTKLNPTGSAPVYSTYLGGSGSDNGRGLAVDGAGNAYVTGQTGSTNFSTLNAVQPTYGGNFDGYVTKLNPDGSGLIYSTYLGGSDFEDMSGHDIALDESRNAYVTGYTLSTNFPTVNAIQPSNHGNFDAFVAKISAFPVPTPVQLTSVVSRKTHGNAGPFNINLPLTGASAIECRSGSANGDYTMVFKFANELTSVDGVSASATKDGGGNQPVTATGFVNSADRKEYIVNLTGVPNAQVLTVSLANVNDSAGNSNDVAVQMMVVAGDTNEDKRVNVGDTNQTKSRSGSLTSEDNFRSDVNLDGRINVGDVNFVKAQAGFQRAQPAAK